MGNKVLVVGGAGYIGSQTAKALARAGHEVVIYDNLSTGFECLAKHGRLVRGDILDSSALDSLLKSFTPHCVMHFAARAEVGESVANPALYYENNVKGSITLLDSLRKHAPKAAFVFSSTCSVYGVSEKPLLETSPLAPMNPYAKTKRMIENLLEDYAAAYGLRFVALRYFNAAGCDSEGEIGELHEPESHLLPRLLLHVLDPAKTVMKIFGDDYPTPDGTCVRDYIHVEDLADAHVRAMAYLASGGSNTILNLGSQKGHSVKQVVAAAEKATGRKLSLPVAPRRAGDPPFLVAGSDSAERVLGWKPKHDLDSIVSTAWAWTRKARAGEAAP